jgi:hypothetical protein
LAAVTSWFTSFSASSRKLSTEKVSGFEDLRRFDIVELVSALVTKQVELMNALREAL